jgi:hypothetical protein
MRFFGTSRALPALIELIEETRLQRSAPLALDLNEVADPEILMSVFEHLAGYWSDQPPTRRTERRRITTRVTVVRGFRAMIQTLLAADDNVVELDTIPERETWIVENVSEGGLGAVLPAADSDSATVGSLLAVQNEGAPSWTAAVVRHLAREHTGERRAGLQLLSKSLTPVVLSPPSPTGPIGLQPDHRAILLSGAPETEREVALLLRDRSYADGKVVGMTVHGRSYALTATRRIEGGDDYHCVLFRVTAN